MQIDLNIYVWHASSESEDTELFKGKLIRSEQFWGLVLVHISVTKHKVWYKKSSILTKERKKNNQSFFCISFDLSLKNVFILIDFFEQSQFCIQMQKKKKIPKATCSERIHVLCSEKNESIAELKRNHMTESTVSFNSENYLRMTGMLFGISKKLSCYWDSFKIQFLKLLFFLYKVCQRSKNTKFFPEWYFHHN